MLMFKFTLFDYENEHLSMCFLGIFVFSLTSYLFTLIFYAQCLSFGILHINLIAYDLYYLLSVFFLVWAYISFWKTKGFIFIYNNQRFAALIFSLQSSSPFRHIKSIYIFFLFIISFHFYIYLLKFMYILMNNIRWESIFSK